MSAVMEATARAKADKAWYLNTIQHKLGVSHRIAYDLYRMGAIPGAFPMPAIPLAVKYDYVGCVNIDDVSDINDPIIVYMYDSWTGQNV